jgi:PRTRC genetic system protein E
MSNFFKQIHGLGCTDLKISIAVVEEQLTVSILPKIDEKLDTLKSIKPLTITGTPEELDQKFFSIVSNPVKQVSELIENTKEIFEEIENAKKANESKKTEKSEPKQKAESKAKASAKTTKKEESPKETVKKETPEFKKLITKLSFYYDVENFDYEKYGNRVLEICNKILEEDPQHDRALEVKSNIEEKTIKDIPNESVNIVSDDSVQQEQTEVPDNIEVNNPEEVIDTTHTQEEIPSVPTISSVPVQEKKNPLDDLNNALFGDFDNF